MIFIFLLFESLNNVKIFVYGSCSTYCVSWYANLLPGGDMVDYIMSRMTDQSKSRRQVIRQLVQLGLISSAKELKKNRL